LSQTTESSQISTKQPEGTQYYFTEEEKKRFRDDPEYHLQYRKGLEQEVNSVFSVFIKDSDYSKVAEEKMRAEMLRRIGPGHEDLKEKLIPSWPPGCSCPTILI
jgi:YHS domain-containing protein